MRARQALLVLTAALLAGALGLAASVAVYGPGPLLRSVPGQWVHARWFAPPDPPGLRIAEPGDPVSAFSLADLDGQAQRLPIGDQRLLINYWASWCEPCREEMPLLSALAREQRGLQVVGIALDSSEAARGFLAGTPVSFQVLVEPPGPRDSSVRLGNRQGVLPFSVLVAADGRLLKRKLGSFKSAAELRDWAGGEPRQ